MSDNADNTEQVPWARFRPFYLDCTDEGKWVIKHTKTSLAKEIVQAAIDALNTSPVDAGRDERDHELAALRAAAVEASAAFKFIRDISSEEYDYQQANPGAECALRHIMNKADTALTSLNAVLNKEQRGDGAKDEQKNMGGVNENNR